MNVKTFIDIKVKTKLTAGSHSGNILSVFTNYSCVTIQNYVWD